MVTPAVSRRPSVEAIGRPRKWSTSAARRPWVGPERAVRARRGGGREGVERRLGGRGPGLAGVGLVERGVRRAVEHEPTCRRGVGASREPPRVAPSRRRARTGARYRARCGRARGPRRSRSCGSGSAHRHDRSSPAPPNGPSSERVQPAIAPLRPGRCRRRRWGDQMGRSPGRHAGTAVVQADEAVALQQGQPDLVGQAAREDRRRPGGAVADDDQGRPVVGRAARPTLSSQTRARLRPGC